MKKVILLLNSRRTISRLATLRYESFYVGVSRVEEKENLRVFKLYDQDIEDLCNLSIPPTFITWVNNYDNSGTWKYESLKEMMHHRYYNLVHRLREKDDLSDFTLKTLQYFTREFDIPIPLHHKKIDLINLLEPIHQQSINLPHHDISQSNLRKNLLTTLHALDLTTLSKPHLLSYAICLGIPVKDTPKKTLIKLLEKIL